MRQNKNFIKLFPSSLYTYSVPPRRQKCYRVLALLRVTSPAAPAEPSLLGS